MKIKKRDGRLEQLSFDKIIYRLKKIKNDATLPNKENSNGKLSSIDTDLVAQKVILSIYDGVSSSELDEEAARIAISMTENPEYARLASRIIISNLHKNTSECFSDIMERLYSNVDKNGKPAPALADDFIQLIRDHKDILNETIDYKRDYLFDYFGFKTLEKSYLMKLNGKIVERPQHLYMRVAVQVHKNDIENVIKTYNLISQHYFTFASPTMFNSGSRLGNLSSCFLIGTHDSIEGIFKTMSDVAKISKVGGGIGIHINNIRSKGSVIRGTNGTSDGIIPMLKVYNSISTYVNQCFTPNTPVYTRDGIKRMDQVTTDDHLVTLDGSFKKVNEVIVNQKSEEILEIAVACGIEPLCCTKVHEIYALRSKSRTGKDRLLEQLRSGVKKASFMPADKLSSNDYVGFPIPTFEQDSDIWTLEKCKAYGTSMIGCAADTVFETAVLHLPKEKLAVVVAAMMDRCVKKQGGLLFTCESLNVIRSFRYMLLRFGILTSRGKKGNTSILKIPKIQALKDLCLFTRFEIPKPPKFKKATAPKTPNVINFFQFENILYCRIKSINKKMYTGDVYDFNMIDNHNYLTDMGLVHNSGKRKGSFAIYLSPEHPDILEFLDLRKNQGSEDLRARDLFYAMWMPDLFMEQVEKDGDWYLMDPDECPGLADAYGKEYAELYWKYVEEKRYKRQIKAQDIWMRILESQIETGNPYIVYKDQANLKSNQKNIGTIKSSNLCVAPETQILTSKGYFQIASLQDQTVEVWNGEEFSETVVRKTGEDQELIKVKFSNGSEIECTKYHKFYIETHGEIKAEDLKSGMKIIDYRLHDNSELITDLYVTDIIHTNRISDTFCFTESKRGMGIFNGIISGQCAEVLLYSDHEQYSVCNLMSISLQKFVKYDERKKPYFDHQLFFDVTKHAVLPMNNIIDYNYYPTPETRKSNLLHRPIGMGSQAISELFIKMRIPFESAEARKLNKEIFETYYFAALTGSMELAKRDGPYSTFKGSPLSEGKFQFDLWAEHNGIDLKDYLSGRWDWESLRKDIMAHGVRNSTLTTCMPTASSAQIMGNTESIEPFDSCIFKRRVLSGEYVVCNKHLVDDLIKLGLWNKELKDTIIAHNGSIQSIDSIPDDIKALYKTVWEMSMKNLIDLSSERGPFICMTQSLNLFMSAPTIKKLTSMHFYGWKRGLKTGIYYLRSKAQASAAKFSIDASLEKKVKAKEQQTNPDSDAQVQVTAEEILACSLENREACELCSS
jgi:ribonucleotide reductase alpha subunit